MNNSNKIFTRTTAREVIIEAIKENFKVVNNDYLKNPEAWSDWFPIYYSVKTRQNQEQFTKELEDILTSIPGMEHVQLSGCDQLCDILQNNFTD